MQEWWISIRICIKEKRGADQGWAKFKNKRNVKNAKIIIELEEMLNETIIIGTSRLCYWI